MTTPFQPRRSQRLSQSSVVRFPNEARSPTPGKLNRVSTPGRLSEIRSSYSYSQPLSSIPSNNQYNNHDDDDDDEEEDEAHGVSSLSSPSRASRYSNFPRVILLKDSSSPSTSSKSSTLHRISSTLAEWRKKVEDNNVLSKKTLIFIFNVFVILGLLFFGYKAIPWTAFTSIAFADLRFMLMVAPDFVMGLFLNPYGVEEIDRTSGSLNIDLIVNKIINNEKFGLWVRELHKNSRGSEHQEIKITEDMEKVIQSIASSTDHSQEIRNSVKQLQDRMQFNKASLEEQFDSLWKQFEELKVLKEEAHRKELYAFESKLKELNDKLGAVKDYLVKSESIVHRCENQIIEMSSKTNDFIRDYMNELIHDNSSKLSLHLQDQFVSQKDMNLIINDMRTHFEGGSQEFSPPAIGNINHFVEKALIKYDADKTGMFDFALESAGGTILSTRCTETYDVSWAVHTIYGIPFWWERNNARTILQPSTNPGECWAFKGSQGSVVVELSRPIKVEAFSLEHISKMMAPERKILSAPRRFTVLGLSSLDDDKPIVFGNFTYDENGNPVQTFPVLAFRPVKLVELKVLSNYGHSVYTCVYRFRVHGTHLDSTLKDNILNN